MTEKASAGMTGCLARVCGSGVGEGWGGGGGAWVLAAARYPRRGAGMTELISREYDGEGERGYDGANLARVWRRRRVRDAARRGGSATAVASGVEGFAAVEARGGFVGLVH